ncbi:hypothetical protein C8R48DRAFT_766561 [Suillus tomentosus]|nr:hypothetical protein C8R48DRAFT_766561 [Suillus tomentosus]
MQHSNLLLAALATDSPIYVYVHSENTRNRVLRLLPLRNDEPFHSLSSRFLFIGYAAHDYLLAPIYWPEEYQEFSSHHTISYVTSDCWHLIITSQGIQYMRLSSGFLKDIRPLFCGPSPQGLLCPIWVLERLNGIPFNLARFPNGFLTPVPPNSVNLPVQVSWNTFDPFVQQQSLSFSEMLLPLSMDFDNDRTVDLTVASTVDNMFESAFDNSSFLSNPLIIDGADVPHEELHWRLTVRDDSLDCNQKKSLKLALLMSCWGRPIKLARYIYMGHILVGMPANPFSMREPDCRQLITTSFLRALHLDLKTYEQICEIPLTVVNNVDSETRVYWSQLRTRFLDYPIDFTSELRKVVRGGTTPDAGFGNNTEQEAQMKLHIIDLMNSGDENMIQEAICQLIATQGFMEILWASLYRPIADFPQGQARLADLYPEAIQTLTGYLGKGIVGVLVTLMYQSFIPAHADRIQLKMLEVYPHIMSALDVMYANPSRFETFFDVARKLPHIREANMLSIDPKTRNARLILDPVTNDRRMKVMDDATLASQQQSATLSDRGIGIWPTQLPRYAKVVSLTDDAYEDNLVRKREISDPPPLVYGDWQELVHPLGSTYFYNSRKPTSKVPSLFILSWWYLWPSMVVHPPPWSSLAPLWFLLGPGPSWSIPGPSLVFLGPSWSFLVPSWSLPGPPWSSLAFPCGITLFLESGN